MFIQAPETIFFPTTLTMSVEESCLVMNTINMPTHVNTSSHATKSDHCSWRAAPFVPILGVTPQMINKTARMGMSKI